MAGDGWLLGALPEDERRLVLASMRRRRFARGEVMFHEGDPGDGAPVSAEARLRRINGVRPTARAIVSAVNKFTLLSQVVRLRPIL